MSLTGVSEKSAAALVAPTGMEMEKLPTAPKSSPTVAVLPVTVTLTTVGATMRDPAFSIAVTVTVCWPPCSVTRVGLSVSSTSVERVSSSLRVSVAGVTGNGEVPLTRRVSSPSTITSLTGVSEKVFCPLGWVAGMVTLKEGIAAKSFSRAAVMLVTVTLTRVSDTRGAAFSIAVTVTVCWPPCSVTRMGFSVSSILVEAVSSSLRVSVAGVTGNGEVPLTCRVSSPSTITSLTGVSEKSASALVAPTGMVMEKLPTAPKSSPTVAVLPSTETCTTVFWVRAPSFRAAVTVTVCWPPCSVTRMGFSVSSIPVEAISSSLRVSVAGVTVNGEVPLTCRVSFPSAITSLTGLSEKVFCPLGWVAGMVTLKEGIAAKSSASAVSPATVTLTTVSWRRVPAFRVAVTVTVRRPPCSVAREGFSVRSIVVDGASLFLTLT